MFLTIQTLFDDANIVSAIIRRVNQTRKDTIYWQQYLTFRRVTTRVFKDYIGSVTGVMAGSINSRFGEKPIRERRNIGSGYGEIAYLGGNFQLQYDLGIRKQYGTEVIAPVFQVLKNGETVQTLPAKISESTFSGDPDVVYYTPASENGGIAVSCQPEDTVELHLLCRDSFGLSYDFTVCTYEIDQNGTMVEEVWPVTDYNVRVSWEK